MSSNSYKIFDNLFEGVQVIDRNYTYYYINKAVVKQAKSTLKELKGKKMQEVFPGIENTEMFSLLKDCMNGREAEKFVNRFEFEDGSVGYFDLRFCPVPEGVLILSIDVTKQKLMEDELRQLNLQLEEVVEQRTQELFESLKREKDISKLKTNFISTVSHEIKTPISAIQKCYEILEKINLPPKMEERKKFHDYINICVNDLFELVDNYKTLDQIEHGKVYYKSDKINLINLMKAKIKKIQFSFSIKQRIEHHHSGPSQIKTSFPFLKSILFNLISNAIKYSNDSVKVETIVKDETLSIIVSDNGIGISEEDQKKILRKFYRSDKVKKYQGSGLGLSIVKEYVNILDGTLKFKSKLGEGSTFMVKLPCEVIDSEKEKS